MDAREIFAAFVAADDVEAIESKFALIKQLFGFDENEDVTIEKVNAAAAKTNLPFKDRKLLTQFQERRNRCSKAPYEGKSIVISGAGPCGLRSAVEARMLGCRVTVVEKRHAFSRHNIVKTWKETISDLLSFGLQTFIPSFKPHGHCHLGIRQIQNVLFKACLLMGVKFHYRMRSVGVCRTPEPQDALVPRWMLCAVPAEQQVHYDHLSLKPSHTQFDDGTLERTSKVDFFERAESEDGAILETPPSSDGVRFLPFDSLLLGEGESSWMIRNLGFERKLVRYSQAIGIVVNLKLRGSAVAPTKAAPESFIVSRSEAEWRSSPLGVLASQGLDVENMEYMTGTDTHFIVVTAKKNSLINAGVVKSDKPSATELLSAENVDSTRLHDFGRSLATAAGLPEDLPFSDFHPVQIFDFSSKGRCTTFLKKLPESGESATSLVFPIGDALQNPFWPQGLGVNRGFHSSLDAVWASQQASFAEALTERNSAWAVMEWKAFYIPCVTAAAGWSCDPTTRYARSLYLNIHMDEVSRHACDKSVLTKRCKDALKLK